MILSLVCSSAAFRPLLSFCKLEGNFVLCHNFNDHNIYINCTANIYSGITVESRTPVEISNYMEYHKVASSNTSCLEAHTGFFRFLMSGIFYPFVL